MIYQWLMGIGIVLIILFSIEFSRLRNDSNNGDLGYLGLVILTMLVGAVGVAFCILGLIARAFWG
jgi:hypothetical protein